MSDDCGGCGQCVNCSNEHERQCREEQARNHMPWDGDEICVCGHDHYTELSQEREMWTTTCPRCPCQQFTPRTAEPSPS